MKGYLIKLFVMINLAVFVLLTGGNVLAQVKVAEQTTLKQNKENHLREIEKETLPGIEKDFFRALEKSESEHLDLIEALGFLKSIELIWSEAVQPPGQKTQPIVNREPPSPLRLITYMFWNSTVITSNDSFRLLFFQATPIQNSRPKVDCLIVTTDTNYKLRDWIKTGCYEDFIKASVEKGDDGFSFKITAKTYSEPGLKISRYKLTSNKITEIPRSN